tara:strand:- start:39 stop:950 length:912 start_codon:yes stop_codon:yes gene_type:complete
MSYLRLKNILFKSPILVASGTYGYGNEVSDLVNVNNLGGIVTKSVTRYPREGNPPPRIAETSSGMLNSIGLANLGVDEYCSKVIPSLNKLETNIIINIAGTAIEDYVETMQILESYDSKHIGYEINISCPNVKEGGMSFGVSSTMTEKLTKALRKETKKILIMKLSPNVTSIEDIAVASQNGGADAISAINTVVGMGIDIKTKRSKLHTVLGGLSGPAIKPIALANIYKIYKVVDIPIIGLGGISCANDIIEFILAGADLVQIGTLNYRDPNIGVRLVSEVNDYCKNNNINNLQDIKGQVIID